MYRRISKGKKYKKRAHGREVKGNEVVYGTGKVRQFRNIKETVSGDS